MRKFAIFSGVVLLLFGYQLWDDGLYSLYREFPGATVCFYTGTDEKLPAGRAASVIANGSTLILSCSPDAAADLRRGLKSLKGESVSFEGGAADAERVLELYAVKSLRTENLTGGGLIITIMYGRSPYLCGGLKVNGDFVNIQIAVNETTGWVTIGTPLILGSY